MKELENHKNQVQHLIIVSRIKIHNLCIPKIQNENDLYLSELHESSFRLTDKLFYFQTAGKELVATSCLSYKRKENLHIFVTQIHNKTCPEVIYKKFVSGSF